MIYDISFEFKSNSLKPKYDLNYGPNLGKDCVSFTIKNGTAVDIKRESPTVLVSQMPEYKEIIAIRRKNNPNPSCIPAQKGKSPYATKILKVKRIP